MPENDRKPSLRFKGFNDAWEQRKINEIFDAISSGNRLPKDNLIEGKIPYVIAMVSNNGIYKHISSNTSDFHGNKMKLFQSPSITFSIDNPEAIFVQNKPFYTSNIMRVLHNIDLDEEAYLFIALQMKKLTKHFDWSLKFSGPVVSNLNISFPIFNGEINFKEVKRIGGLIREIDNLITLHQRKYDKLVSVKKALLDKMFPENGNDVPKVRFKGFTDAWEQCKLKNIFTEVVDNRGKTPPLSNEGIPLIEIASVGEHDVNYVRVSKFLSDYSYANNLRDYLLEGDLLFSTVGTTALTSIYKSNVTAAVAQNIIGLRSKRYYPSFLHYLISNSTNNSQIKTIQMTGVQFSIKVPQLLEVDLLVSKCYQEQLKIGSLLASLDHIITLHQRKHEKLQNIKKALLSKMFA